MNICDIITKKKRGGTLTRTEIACRAGGYVGGTILDDQTAELLMASCLRGMTIAEAPAPMKRIYGAHRYGGMT